MSVERIVDPLRQYSFDQKILTWVLLCALIAAPTPDAA
jgi:hypothetical protein